MLREGPAAAAPVFDQQAIAVLETGPNRWELGVALLGAAVARSARQAEPDGLPGPRRTIFVKFTWS